MQSYSSVLLAVVGLGAVFGGPPSPTQGHVPQLTYTVRFQADPPRWNVSLEATGLPSDGEETRLRLDDWGEWTQTEGGYLRDLTGEPSVRPDPERRTDFVVSHPREWNGTLRIRYAIPAVHYGDGHTLLPYAWETYSLGFTNNTLMRLIRGDAPMAANATLELYPPDGWIAATGWAGLAQPGRPVRLPAAGENRAIVFGAPLDRAGPEAHGDARPVLGCLQFGAGEPSCRQILTMARALTNSFVAQAGGVLPDSIHLIIAGGRSGGTGTVLGYTDNFNDDPPSSTAARFLAHELHHFVTPGAPGNSLVWFTEGVTEYLALWHATAVGFMHPTEFASRLEGKARAAHGNPKRDSVTFGNPSVPWRAGAHEELAYEGGTVLAFALDVALRAAGRSGLARVIRDVRPQSGNLSHEHVRAWLDVHGLEELRRRYVEGTETPDVQTALRRIGYRSGRREAYLSYPGIQTDAGVGPGHVLAIDPEGPTAKTDLRVGDVIIDYRPKATTEVHLPERFSTRYRFGLNLFERGGACCTLRVVRNADTISLDINPWLSPGGWQEGLVGTREEVGWFFR